MSQVADTIYQHLGGNKFCAMTNMSAFDPGPDRLTFRIGTNPKKVKIVVIILEANDTYTVHFIRVRGIHTSMDTVDSIYADQLQEVFSRYTGLDTHL